MGPDHKRILVIEDDREMRSLLQDFIEDAGFEVDAVADGSEAFRKLARETFDLMITDIRMPGLSGIDILPGLKKLLPQAPVIVITAFGSEKVHHKILERGGNAYLEKPIHLEELRLLIKRMIAPPEERK
jgi:DNA-binding response OmpR family regulator